MKVSYFVYALVLSVVPLTAMHRMARIAGHIVATDVISLCARTASPTSASVYSLKNPALKRKVMGKFGSVIVQNKALINSILDKELKFEKDGYYVLYHGHNNLFYVLQEVLRMLWNYENPTKKLPASFVLLRFWHDPAFKKLESTVQSYLDRHGGAVRDTLESVADVLLSTNLTIFGNTFHSGSTTLDYFLTNQSAFCDESRIQSILEGILRHYGFNTKYARTLLDEFKKLGVTQGCLLQIFIPKGVAHDGSSSSSKLIDECFFVSGPTATHVSAYKYAQGPCKGATIAAADFDKGKNRYIRSSNIVDERLRHPEYFAAEDLDSMQGRLFINQRMLNPESGIQIHRYTTMSADKIAVCQTMLQTIFEQMQKDTISK